MKIREELLQQVKQIRTSAIQITTTLGDLVIDENNIKLQKEELLKNYSELIVSEKNLIDTINKEYGEGNLDLATGEFTPTEQK
jgi:hypothetical protein